MSFLNPEPRFLDDGFRSHIEPTALGFLRQLDGLTIFDLKGEDSSRTRVMTTLIHGNEPSGFIASHLWLRSKSRPKTNIRLIICNPEAARSTPIFTNRYIAHTQDLNRFFNVDESDNSEIANRARLIKTAVQEVNPEAILDLHNTSGSSPAFGVSVKQDEEHLDLVALFANRLIYTGLKVGAIMEEEFGAPIVTIECGGASDVYSHQVATDGLHRYLTLDNIFQHPNRDVSVHRHPIRVQLREDASVGFAHHQLPTTDVTLRADVEQLNQQITTEGEFIGWYDTSQEFPIIAKDENGKDQSHQLFEFKGSCFFARTNMQLFMVTTILEIATNDCICYATLEI